MVHTDTQQADEKRERERERERERADTHTHTTTCLPPRLETSGLCSRVMDFFYPRKIKLRLQKENPLCVTKQVGWDRQNVFAAPTALELATGTVWEVNLTTPANTITATGLPQVL